MLGGREGDYFRVESKVLTASIISWTGLNVGID